MKRVTATAVSDGLSEAEIVAALGDEAAGRPLIAEILPLLSAWSERYGLALARTGRVSPQELGIIPANALERVAYGLFRQAMAEAEAAAE
jgi:hypothetical protein